MYSSGASIAPVIARKPGDPGLVNFTGAIMKNRDKGFTLIELLIVVAIILIIAAIAIPNLLRSKMAANEASAVGSLRTITTAGVNLFLDIW
jgi:prepilin-type N-terminal cleavage/methylation domain-containing protein